MESLTLRPAHRSPKYLPSSPGPIGQGPWFTHFNTHPQAPL